MENIELSDEIQKIRERTFNPEFKELIAKVINKPDVTIDNPNMLLYSLHELYYTFLSRSFNDSASFINPEINYENRLQFIGEELSGKLKSLGFVESVIFLYDFKQNYFGILTNSFSENIFRDFFITLSDDIYKKILHEPDGVVIDFNSIKNDELYKKRIVLFDEQSFLIWAFSTYHLVKKILSFFNIPCPAAIEIFCPIIFVKVHEKFTINDNIMNELYCNCISIIFSLVELYSAISKSSLFYGSNYFHEVFKVFENYYYISKASDCTKYVIIKSKFEDQNIYCLFRYLSQKFKELKSVSCINYRPMIGLILLFIYEENKDIEDEIRTLSSIFIDSIKIGIVDKSKINNPVSLYKYIVDL
ncbi:MAG: hypothetical protein N3F66_05115 [Spirochaetes bacterium]|nr:hypothetical protein [Spirochaetota bacterium]